MALIIKDRVKETTTSFGTGSITLSGAETKYVSFGSVLSNSDTVYYAIEHSGSGTDEWEVGLGTYTSSTNSISRDTILASSSSGSAVNFSVGSKSIFATYPADKAIYENAAGHVDISGNITVGGTVDGRDLATDGTKLDGIESGATADQTASEIKTAYESNSNTNAYTDAEKTKLAGIETNADVTDTTNVTAAGALMDSEVTNLAQVKAFNSADYATAAQGTTADSAVQPNDSPTFGNITVTGTVDGVDIAARDAVLTSTTTTANAALPKAGGTMTGNIVMAGAQRVDGRDLSVDGAKLDNIEANADVTDTANVTAAGALMDSEVTDLDGIKSLTVPNNTTISTFGASLVDDASASAARTTLGLGTAATTASTDYATAAQGTKADNALPKAGGTMTGNIVMSGAQTVDGRDLSVDGTKLDGIEANATADQTAGEIEAIVNHDNLQGFVANEHIDWTASGAGTIHATNIPVVALTTVQTAANQTAHLALTAQEGDIVVRSDENKSYVHNGGTAGTMADYTELLTPTDAVLSVNGQTGAVVISNATTSSDGLMSSTDKTKLNGIEANADVTDATNVQAAGALMDSEVTNLAQVKAFDSTDYATAAQGTTADNALPKAGGTMTGNIVMSGAQTVDGRDLSVDGAKLDGVASGAEVNQNAFANVAVSGQTTVAADSKTDTLTLAAGSNVTITTNATTDTVTIASTDTTYSNATTSADGLMSSSDKTKLDGIETNADVTDTANVTAAGALMDSEVTNLAQVKAFNSADYATAAQGTTADNALPKAGGTMTGNIVMSGAQTVDGRDLSVDGTKLDGIATSATANPNAIDNVVEDLTPQLGGDLASNGNDILFADNDKAIFGTGSDLQIWHDGSNSYIKDAGTGDLRLQAAHLYIQNTFGQPMIDAQEGGSVNLYHNTSLKLGTNSSGVSVTGNIAVTGTVDGRDVATDGTKLDGIEAGANVGPSLAVAIALG
jgi:hypothetical protein